MAAATIGLPTRVRFSLGKEEPNMVVMDSILSPPLSTSRCAPARSSALAIWAPSAAVLPRR